MKTRFRRRDPDRNPAVWIGLWIADLLLLSAFILVLLTPIGEQGIPKPSAILARRATSTPTGTPTAEALSFGLAPSAGGLSPTPTSNRLFSPTSTPAGPASPTLTRTGRPLSDSTASATLIPVSPASPTLTRTGRPSPNATPANTPSARSTPARTDTLSVSPPTGDTPSASTTPGEAPSPTPTPGNTPPETSTPGPTPSPTPSPTNTRLPTQTPWPTYTPYPTPAPPPTYTPFPAPTPVVGLSSQPITIILNANPDLLLGPDGPEKEAERERLRQQIRDEFEAYASDRAGVIFTFGISPRPLEGNRLAGEVNRLLVEEFPDLLDGAILRDYHIINSSPSQRGQVEVEVYLFIGSL